MLKRTLAIFLVLIMVMSALPLGVVAESQSTAQKNTTYAAPLAQHDHAASGDAHICEHCVAAGKTGADAVPQWQAWSSSNTTLPQTPGHYYLTGDMTITSGTLDNEEVVICLNGYTVTAKSSHRFYTLKNSAKLTILDCTAKTVTPENENDTGYRAGKLTGATNCGFMFEYNSANASELHWYDGILSNVSRTDSGGAFCVQGASKLFIYGGEFTDSKSTKNGGLVYLGSATCSMVAENATFLRNQGTNGGVVYSNAGVSTWKDCTFIGNTASGYGAAFAGTGGSLTATGCTFTGHTAANFGVICGTGGGVKVTLDSCRITDNSITGDNGAVFVPNSGCQLNLKGSTYIYGNTRKGGAQGNIHLQNDGNGNYSVVTVDGLTEDAKIGINVAAARLEKTKVLSEALSGSLTREQVIEHFYSDDPTYMIDLADDKLVLAEGHVHTAHLTACTDSGCTGHENQLYLPWSDANKLPTSGNYYLEVDVTTKTQPKLSTGTLNLCLNGKTITITNRFEISGDAVLNITDCNGNTGKIVGSSGTVFYMIGDASKKSYVNLYEGLITDCVRTTFHASVAYIQNNSTLNMYGGEITGNTVGSNGTDDRGGTIYLHDSKGTFNMYGGKITNNKAVKAGGKGGNGAAIFSNGGTVNIQGGEISGNTAEAYGGAIWAKGGKVTVKNAKITGNTAANTSAIFGAGGGVQITLDGAVITGNTATSGYGAVYIPNGGAKIIVSGATKVESNKGGNVFLVKDTNTTSPSHPMITLGAEGLAEGAHIGITMPQDRMTAEPYASLALGGKLTEDQVKAYFFCDNTDYQVVLQDDRLLVKPVINHSHCVCGTPDCTEHTQVEYKAWTDPNSLPSEGDWYLDTDVSTTQEVTIKKNLNLCLNGHKVTGKTSGNRFYSTSGTSNEVLTVSDCTAKTENGVYTAGGFYNNTYTNTGVAGGAIFMRPNSTLHFYDGIMEGCTAYAGGGAIYGNKGSSINIYNGKFTGNKAANGNTWRNGGVIYLLDASLTIHDGQFTGNEGENGAVIYTSGKCALDIRGGSFTGNVSHASGAILAPGGGSLAFSGAPVIIGNTNASGAAANVYLGGCKMDVANLDEKAQIAVTAPAFSAISTKTQDYSKNFLSDDPMVYVVYQDEVLYTLSNSDHKHCLCAMASAQGCDHTTMTFHPWTNPNTLPSSGNYYLDVDVTISAHIPLQNTTLNLCLNGHTVTVGKQGGRVFRMNGDCTLNITDCAGDGKLTGATQGVLLSDGGASNMALNLYNGTLTGNHGKATGGALVIQGGCTFNMYGGKITENSASSYLTLDADGNPKLDANGNQIPVAIHAGGVYVGAGAAFNMYGGEISNNKAIPVEYLKAGATAPTQSSSQGGGLYVTGCVANLYGGKISGNEAPLGGGIYVRGNGGILNLEGVEISGNKGSNGGGIISQTGAVINMKSGVIKDNYTTADGGGIYVSSNTSFNMTGGEITGNNGNNGGGIFFLKAKVNITGGVITGNTARNNGGGFGTSSECEMTVSGMEISKNTAKNGGGILVQGKTVLDISNCKITNNKVTQQGGGGFISANTTVTMTGNTITNNTSTGNGGGLSTMRAKVTIKSGNNISYNTASNGGGINIAGGTVTISGGSIVGNRAIGTLNKSTGKYSGGNGGGIMAGRSVYKVNGVNVSDLPVVNIYSIYLAYNKSNAAAGGMLVQSENSRINMYGGTIAYNEAPNSDGGGAYFSTKILPNIQNVSFYGNKARGGAAFVVNNNKGTFSNIKCYNNESTSSGAGCIFTGAETIAELKNMEFYDNVAQGSAGAFVAQSRATVNMESAKIYGNSARSNSGAVYFSSPAYGTFKDVEIYENKTEQEAGGLFMAPGAEVTLEDVTIRDNEAGGMYGGAIASRGRLDMKNVKILNNQCAENGGGIVSYRVASRYTGQYAGIYAENCVISGNTAGIQGGGVYNHRGGPIYLTNCTITDNTAAAEGGGIYSDGRLGLTDVTITGNTSGGDGYALYFTPSEFDGHSYSTGHKRLGGNMIVKDNEGGDVYLSEGSTVAITGGPLGEKSHMEVTLHSGVLTNSLFGVYDYEGGNLVYTVTAGERSLTDPEDKPLPAEEETEPTEKKTEKKASGDIWLYVGIGVLALIVIAVIVLLTKKKAGKTAEKANKE